MIELHDEHLEQWASDRLVVLRGALDPGERVDLTRWTDELAAWPETPGRWMKYFEGDDRRLCRVENFLPFHAGLRDRLLRPDLMAVLGQLFGEPAVLFKEKINFKLPGGSGFAPHQDAPAFVSFGQTWHVTAMIPVDPSTPENGCLEYAPGHTKSETLSQAADGTLAPELVETLEWRPLPAQRGDIVLFDSYVPHRSAANASVLPRRVFYVTYNPISQGDRRAAYFARKRRVFPPECERDADAPLNPESAVFNLGNPIR